ncbi:MAG: Hemolysin-type calcium binding protein, partial [uncultured Sulfurovum sp.]
RKWAEYAVYFVGTGSQQVISLKELDTQNNGLGTIIDNVKLEASKEMIVNGSFEKFTVEVNNGRWKLVTFDAWDGEGEVWNNRLGKRSTKGTYKIELDVGRELNVLSQTVTTENRVEYELTLDAYARRLNSSDFEIWIDEEKLETVKPIKEWKNYSFKFFGNGETQKISIKEVESQNNRLGTVIDNISLVSTGEFSNRPPVIEGVAQKVVSVYELYRFKPKTTDIDGDSLVYSIENKPLWIDFNITTGELKGVVPVGSEGNYSNIVISVNDGTETVSLAPFEIEVQAALDIAHKYGKATQGTDSSYYYYSSASNAIDKDDSTYNHTRGGKNGKNWLQLELPNPTIVSKVVLQNRSHSSRISNAKVYLSDRPYTGTVDES